MVGLDFASPFVEEYVEFGNATTGLTNEMYKLAFIQFFPWSRLAMH
jgi:hypothetical protein